MKTVIFDLDGTLADTLESIAYCTNKALAQFGLAPFPVKRYRYFVGDGAAELIRRSLLASGDQELIHYDAMVESYGHIFEQDCMYKVAPYEGIPDTLRSLKEKGVKLAVLSNKPHERTVEVVQTLFGDHLFDVVQGQTPAINKKPSPDGVFAIAEQIGAAVDEILYVGDTDTDMKTGKAAGVFTVGVLWGFRDRSELEDNHADKIIAHPRELVCLV